jgi:hypothetical protein
VDTKILFKNLYGTNNWNKIKDDFKSDLNGCKAKDDLILLHNRYIPYLWLERALNTVLAKYTELRNIIKDSDNKHKNFALDKVFQLGNKDKDKSIYQVNNKHQKAKVVRKNKDDKIEISYKIIENIVIDLKYKIDNNDFELYRNQNLNIVKSYHIALLLGLCTGRRQIEILKTLSIFKDKDDVLFGGIAKKINIDTKFKSKLLFINIKEAKHYLKNLRKTLNLDDLTNREVNQKFSGSLNIALNKYIKNFIDRDFKFHELRKIYAEVCYIKFGGSMDKDLFYKNILSHEVEPTSATHYMDFLIK